jgi:hypothetical protein
MSNLRTTASVTFGILMLASGISGCGSIDDLLDGLHSKHPPKGAACTSTAACAAGSFCTVETGVCNPPPGCNRDGGVCPAVCYGTCEKKPVEPTPACRSDADCRPFAFMCTGCDCLPLATGSAEPMCPGPGVQCFADPCLNKTTVCDAGQCRIKETSCPAGSVARRVCLQCGPAGGCAKVADCARPCQQTADCAAEQTTCTDGLCQMVGCI